MQHQPLQLADDLCVRWQQGHRAWSHLLQIPAPLCSAAPSLNINHCCLPGAVLTIQTCRGAARLVELVTSREAWLPASGEGVADLAQLALQPTEAIACRGLHALAALHDVVLQGGHMHTNPTQSLEDVQGCFHDLGKIMCPRTLYPRSGHMAHHVHV